MRTKLMLIGAVLLYVTVGCQDRTGPAAVEAESPARSPASTPAPTPAENVAAGGLTLLQGNLGPYLADAAGSALYALVGDTAGAGCVDVCLEVWPPMLVATAQPTAGPGVLPNLVSTVQRPTGSNQVTYANQPLYRYAGDTGAERTTGHGVSDQWGQWHLVGPDGQMISVEGR